MSSPERYAAALGLSPEEVRRRKERHLEASEALHAQLEGCGDGGAAAAVEGRDKHALKCRHRLAHGRHPFACPRCWAYLPVCVCAVAGPAPRRPNLPAGLEVTGGGPLKLGLGGGREVLSGSWQTDAKCAQVCAGKPLALSRARAQSDAPAAMRTQLVS